MADTSFEVRLRREGFQSIGILVCYGDGLEGILIEAVSEAPESAVAAYNASVAPHLRVLPGQVIEQMNMLRDSEAMLLEIADAPVVTMRINPRLTRAQAGVALCVKKYREASQVLESLADVDVDDVAQCSICLEQMDKSTTVARSPCGHCFHKACISKWLVERRRTCPLCNFQLRKGSKEVVRDDMDEVRTEMV